MTEPFGPQAAAVERFWWFAFWMLTAVYVIVMAALAWAVWRRRRGRPETSERRLTIVVAGGTIATTVLLFVFLGVDLVTGRSIADLPRDSAISIVVTGHQWWWEIEYEAAVPARRLTTANELHIPVGRPVRIKARSRDVIHSLWIPQLHGKRDLIPGTTSEIWLRADSAGVFVGQCAEFCGNQHAKMRLVVVAEPEAEFRRWYEWQLRPAPPPTDSLAILGSSVFLTKACALCHSVRGTPAGGRIAPELTHLASRRMIAAGILPNTRGHLGGWILDPQRIKPGAKMPPTELTPAELNALLAWLEGLR